MISLQQMRYLLILSEERQFLKASERCFVTQPTLSMQVKKAEEQLGYAVFDRSSNPLALTPYGEEVLPIIREILEENQKLKAISDRLEGKLKEEIRIGIIPTVSVYMISALFDRLSALLPQVRVVFLEHRTEELLSEMEHGALDLALLAGPYQQPKFRTIPLFTEEIELYGDLGEEKAVDVLALDGHQPWLLNKGNCLRTQIINFCKIQDEPGFAWDYQGGNLDLLITMVNQNGGYTLLPSNFRSPLERKGYRKKIHSAYGRPAREIIAVFSQRSYKVQHLEKMVREIQHTFTTKDKGTFCLLDWK